MFELLEKMNARPKPFEFYTAEALWNDEYTSQQMLNYHLNPDIDVSSRKISFINRSVDWMVKQFNIQENTKIADFGCGPGLYANRLAKNKARVTGIDFSSRSIDYAQKTALSEGLQINYLKGNYLAFESSEQFDIIMMIMCDFCALSPIQRQGLLAKYKSLLKPDGVLLLDVYSINVFDKKEESASYEKNQLFHFWSPDDYYAFVNCFKYPAEKVMLDKYTIIEKNDTKTVYNWLQCFSLESITREIEEAGLKIKEKYANVAGDAYDAQADEFALIICKS